MAAADKEIKTGFNTPVVVLCGATGVVFLIAMALFIQGGFLAAQANEVEVKVYDAPGNQEALASVAEQQALLGETARWLDEENGTLCMPIEDAMEQYVNKGEKSQ